MSAASPPRKVVVIGLDGLEPTIVDAMLEAGQLPHLAQVAQRGGYSRVATTTPAQTPVAWSTFATGTNPGGHGIFDFLRRDPATYRPDLALNTYEQKGAWLPPRAVNLRRGTPVWDILAASGMASTILRCPCTYPARLDRGRMLSGMGVPDLRGGLGTPTVYSADPSLVARESESVMTLEPGEGSTFKTRLVGPRNPKDRSTLYLPIELRPGPETDSIVIRSDGSPRELVVRQGCWSEWLRVRFPSGLLQSVRGMVRFYLNAAGPPPQLYASPINFDPEHPLFPISDPPRYAQELTESLGTFHTTGMVEDHTGLNNERIDEAAFLDQCEDAWVEREEMMAHELARFSEGLFYCLFDTPDRVQHMFWRFREPNHPANRGRETSTRWAGVVEDQYRRADAVVGRALSAIDDQTLLIVLSDHGFGSFRRGVHLNSWLRDHGYLTPRDSAGPDDFPGGVDWSRTRAYSVGLGAIYLNLRGREGQGIVEPRDANALAAEIAANLTGLKDDAQGTVAVRKVLTREQLYHGPHAAESPDLVVGFSAGYRASWATTLGGAPPGLFEDNVKKWGGDHIVDPELVPGVLLMNRPFRGEGARLLDLAPTILDALGVAPGPAMEGSSLLS